MDWVGILWMLLASFLLGAGGKFWGDADKHKVGCNHRRVLRWGGAFLWVAGAFIAGYGVNVFFGW